ncbi:MAG TPA: hypothetical protein VFQ22_13975 [Longimicrobiales bacterium]|nr:hypothetical protein [Longimicrobiales bacterium]
MAVLRPLGVRRCPRCSYQGEGIPYFRRGGHVALLAGVSLFTYGFGGLIYWLARRRHLICPRCGLGWEHASSALALAGPEPERSIVRDEAERPLPSAGVKRRILGAILVLAACLTVLLGFVQADVAAIVTGAILGASGSLTFYWGWNGLQERRNAVMQRIQRKVLRLAAMRGGTLTVTEVASELNLALPAAEKILTSMDDGFRVRSEISNEGVLYYEFPEILHRKSLRPAE